MANSDLVLMEDEQLAAHLVHFHKEPAREIQLEIEAHQRDGASWKPEEQTHGEFKQVVKKIDMEPEQEENWHPEETSMEADMPNKIALDLKEYRTKTKQYLGIVIEQLSFASLEILFQELLVLLNA